LQSFLNVKDTFKEISTHELRIYRQQQNEELQNYCAMSAFPGFFYAAMSIIKDTASSVAMWQCQFEIHCFSRNNANVPLSFYDVRLQYINFRIIQSLNANSIPFSSHGEAQNGKAVIQPLPFLHIISFHFYMGIYTKTVL
jgi:hypothetical protein